MSYAEITDAAPLLKKMAEYADAGLPFVAIEFDPTTYQVETAAGLSNMPTYDDIEASNWRAATPTMPRRTRTSWQSPWASRASTTATACTG